MIEFKLIIYLAPHGVWNGWAQFPQAEGLQKTQILAWAGEALRLRRLNLFLIYLVISIGYVSFICNNINITYNT